MKELGILQIFLRIVQLPFERSTRQSVSNWGKEGPSRSMNVHNVEPALFQSEDRIYSSDSPFCSRCGKFRSTYTTPLLNFFVSFESSWLIRPG